MSRDELHQLAQNDTPAAVEVPKSFNGLVIWALARFGGGAIFAVACFWVYKDMRADRAELFNAYRENIEVMRDFKASLETQTREIAEIRRNYPTRP
jgi:hypothetical protein